MMSRCFADVRDGFRFVRRAPGFCFVVVLTIALGVGSNTALFTLLNAIALRPLDVADPDRLVLVSVTNEHGAHDLIPLPTIDEFARRQQAFESFSGYENNGLFDIEIQGVRELASTEVIRGPYYAMLGVRPFLGRLIPGDDLPEDGDAPRLVVLGYGYWLRRFGGDRSVIGQTLRIADVPVTIIGVTEPRFRGLHVESAPDITVPIALMRQAGSASPNRSRPIRANYLVAKLRPGVTVAQAQMQVVSMWPALTAATVPTGYTPEEQKAYRVQRVTVESIETGISSLRPRYQQPLVLLLLLSTLLLVVGCVNLTGLMMARTAARGRELSVRVALGAARGRLTQQLLTESLLLVLLGSAAAVPLAWWTARALGTMMWTGSVPLAVPFAPDWRVLGVAAATTLAAGVAVGIFPSMAATRRTNLTAGHSGRSVTSATGRLGRVLLVAQLALSLVLLVGAGLLTASLQNLYSIDPGFRTRDLTFGRTFGVPGGYNNLDEPTYYQSLLQRLSALQGVRSVAFSRAFPGPLLVERTIARTDTPDPQAMTAATDSVSPRFFAVAGMSLLQGRDFDARDDRHSPAVAIITRNLAERLFGSASALGHHIRVGADPAQQALEIVGVSSDARFGNIRKPAPPIVFRPFFQELPTMRQPILQILTSAPPPDLADRLRRTVGDMGHEYLPFVQSIDEQIDRTLLQERVMARLASCFAALAMLLAFVGVYGLLSYGVSRRTREIGVRMALGASRGAVLGLVMRQGLAIAGWGVLAGVPLALAAARLAGSFLFDLSPSDPLILSAAAIVFAVVAAAAGVRPAHRASRIDPLVALRCD